MVSLGLALLCLGYLSGRFSVKTAVLSAPEEASSVTQIEVPLDPDFIKAYPSEVRQTSHTGNLLASPYLDGLIKVRCRGLENDPKTQFFAVFQCKKNGEALGTAYLRSGVRLKLDMIPFDEAPTKVKEMAMADDVDDLRRPVYWVRSFQHDDATLHLAENKARFFLSQKFPNSVLKSRHDLPVGSEHRPLYMYGANWQLYGLEGETLASSHEEGLAVSAITNFGKHLRKHGTELIVVPVPQSASLYADVLLGQYDGMTLKTEPPNKRAFDSLVAALKQHDIQVCDLTTPLAKERIYSYKGEEFPSWLVNDTHWSSWATVKAAEALAPLVRQVIQSNGRSHDAPILPKEQFDVTWNTITWHGDISGLAAVKDLGITVPPCETHALQVTGLTKEAAHLLEENSPEAAVHIMGDSFLQIFSGQKAGIRAHLIKELGQGIFHIAKSAGGKNAPPVWVKEHQGRYPKVVIWMFTERCLGEYDWSELQQVVMAD